MQNKLLQVIFPDSAAATSDSSIGVPVQNSNIDAVAKTFSQLVLPQTGNENSLLGIAGEDASAASRNFPELFNDVSKNLDRLRAVTETQAKETESNTAALSTNTATKGVGQVLSSVGHAASGFLGGLAALPLISGIVKLFGGGGGSEQPPSLSKYTAPEKVTFEQAVQSGTGGGTTQETVYDRFGNPRLALSEQPRVPDYAPLLGSAQGSGPNTSSDISDLSSSATSEQGGRRSPAQTSAATHVTVNVQAMDSQSFMDRSHDIAQAVRDAMLNMHSINDVVNDL